MAGEALTALLFAAGAGIAVVLAMSISRGWIGGAKNLAGGGRVGGSEEISQKYIQEAVPSVVQPIEQLAVEPASTQESVTPPTQVQEAAIPVQSEVVEPKVVVEAPEITPTAPETVQTIQMQEIQAVEASVPLASEVSVEPPKVRVQRRARSRRRRASKVNEETSN